jgi:hypothetical protein
LYSSLLEYLNASDMVRSDHDSYEHDGGGANLVLADRSLTSVTKKLNTTIMNKNMGGLVRGIALIIKVYLRV